MGIEDLLYVIAIVAVVIITRYFAGAGAGDSGGLEIGAEASVAGVTRKQAWRAFFLARAGIVALFYLVCLPLLFFWSLVHGEFSVISEVTSYISYLVRGTGGMDTLFLLLGRLMASVAFAFAVVGVVFGVIVTRFGMMHGIVQKRHPEFLAFVSWGQRRRDNTAFWVSVLAHPLYPEWFRSFYRHVCAGRGFHMACGFAAFVLVWTIIS